MKGGGGEENMGGCVCPVGTYKFTQAVDRKQNCVVGGLRELMEWD